MERGLRRIVSRRWFLGLLGSGAAAALASEACKSESNLSTEEFTKEFNKLFGSASTAPVGKYTFRENQDFSESSVRIDYTNVLNQKKVISLQEFTSKDDGSIFRVLYLNTHDDPDSLDDPDTEIVSDDLYPPPFWSKHIYKPYGERIDRSDWQDFLELVNTEMEFARNQPNSN